MLVFALTTVIAFIALLGVSSPLQADETNKNYTLFLPLVVQPSRITSRSLLGLNLVNQRRSEAGVPPVDHSGQLDRNCFEHARYMAKNNVLTHDQDPGLPYATPGGEACAKHSNAWLGSNRSDPDWRPADSIEGWMKSVAHRLWLLYPTTTTVGYGFFDTETENRAAAALDILSHADFSADDGYADWPVVYPGERSRVPPSRYPITLHWGYFGPRPSIGKTSLRIAGGRSLVHDANTDLPGGHKGIQIWPQEDLPPGTQFEVAVQGTYDGAPFHVRWFFHTGE